MSTLASLLAELAAARLVRGDSATPVTGVDHDSRRVQPGQVFFAIPGFSVDGHAFLATAAAAGTAALVVQEDRLAGLTLPIGPPVVAVPDTRRALSAAAAWFYGHPSRELVTVGITGTDGKTTTSHLLSSIFDAAGIRSGRLGTVDVWMPGRTGMVEGRMTTPEAPEVQRILREMAGAGCTHAVVESTSHGLALDRLADVEYDVAAFTNVTGDHLDFHKTFEAYREAKGLLFSALERPKGKAGRDRAAVVNLDDPSAHHFLALAPGARHLTYALEDQHHGAEVTALRLSPGAAGTEFVLATPQGEVATRIALPALFNVANALCAAACALAAGVALPAIAQGLAACPGVPGRMEPIDAGQPFGVIVDYAHTGDAVRKVLALLREVTSRNLIVVVGAAGERDPGRRFGVARAAAAAADFAIFTNEDPRSEDPAAIVREIGQHAESAGRERGRDFSEIEDRAEAIHVALARAGPGDVVVICGKGHEQSIVYGTEARPWDDRDVTRAALASLGFTPP
ncbi:MAG: UDP-N-acetylmuramoyl-L-alanyl-D-glutamate--2,6-diaminopimelate ligase [Dehalococcoidia bacterium]|nr:UDP-N-acetylmuramoyl-L-alanyl-D-glutamate--2,6-diaminopimelate ligase [Dehalococcoidia bacterium]